MDRIYNIGGHRLGVSDGKWADVVERAGGFGPFEEKCGKNPEFMLMDGAAGNFPGFKKTLYTFRHEDVDCSFGTTDRGYLLELALPQQEPLQMWARTDTGQLLLHGNDSPRLLRFALWIGYGIMTARNKTVALHGSCIVYEDKAVLFLGESGTGKSTHTRLWREHIAGSKLLNDDSPVVSYTEGRIWIYGSPWSGKTPCYKAERYPLAACVRLSQAPYNQIEKLNIIQGFAAVHPSAPPAFAYDEWLYDGVCGLLDKLLSSVPVYHLSCLPDRAAAELVRHTLYER